MTEQNKSRVKGASAAVLEYLDKHQNVTLYVNDIAQELQLTKEQVQAAVTNLRYRDIAGSKERLKIELNGSAWIMHSKVVHSTDLQTLYVKAYESKSGKTIVEDEDGNLYILIQI